MTDSGGERYEPDQVAEVYRHTFAARLDAYAEWFVSPGCSHDGKECRCHWRVAGRYDDEGQCVERYPLTNEVIRKGLGKDGSPVSGYMQSATGFTHVAAIDLDRDDGWDLGLRIARLIEDDGGYPMPERSRRGAHLWIELSGIVPADQVRLALREWVRRTDPYAARDQKVEYRPARVDPRAPLSVPMRMPMMRHPGTGKRYPLCGPDGSSLGASITDILLNTEVTPADLVEETARSAKIPANEAHVPAWSRRPAREGGDVVEILLQAGVDRAAPGRAVKCPLHDDQHPSLSISRDGERVWCKSPGCVAYNDGRGLGADQLASHLRGGVNG